MEGARRAGLMQITFATQSGRAGGAARRVPSSRAGSGPGCDAAAAARGCCGRSRCSTARWQRLRRTLYRRGLLQTERVGVPVIVVGNVIAGGAGKTPVVMALVEHLQRPRPGRSAWCRAATGAATDDCREVPDDSDPRDVGDEPLLIRRSTGAPVFVARTARRSGARPARRVTRDTQLIVSDDGLQHLRWRATSRSASSTTAATGNGWLLPAGPLREPWPRRCDLVLHTGVRPALRRLRRARRGWPTMRCGSTARAVPLASLAGRALIAVAAIAQARSLLRDAARARLIRSNASRLPDHDDFADWIRRPAAGYTLICTEKDARQAVAPGPRCAGGAAGVRARAGVLRSARSQSYHRSMDTKLLELLVCPVTKGPLDVERREAGARLAQRPSRLPGARRHPGAARRRGAHAFRRRTGASDACASPS